MEKWRYAWRNGFAPQFSSLQLESLRHALAEDDKSLIQGAITRPSYGREASADCASGCLVAHAFMPGTVRDVMIQFQEACYIARAALHATGSTNDLLHWFDQEPRLAVRANLLVEVDAELLRREYAQLQATTFAAPEAREALREALRSVAHAGATA